MYRYLLVLFVLACSNEKKVVTMFIGAFGDYEISSTDGKIMSCEEARNKVEADSLILLLKVKLSRDRYDKFNECFNIDPNKISVERTVSGVGPPSL